MPDKTSFLDRTAFEPGEFETQSTIFQRLSRGLSEHLVTPVGNAFRKEAHGAADAFVKDALASVRAFLNETTALREFVARSGPEAEGLRRFLEGKLDGSSISAHELEPRIREASDQLAQLVAARWLDRLERKLRDHRSIDLTSEMLPMEDHARDILGSLDLSEFAVEMRDVIQAFAAFRQELTSEATQTFIPIELGTRLFAMPDSRREGGEYKLFADRASGQRFADDERDRVTKHLPSGPDRWALLESVFVDDAYGFICETTINRRPPPLDMEQVLRLIALSRKRHAKQICNARLTKEMTSIVETTLSAMVRGNLEGAERAGCYLRNEVDAYASRLRSLAHRAGASIEDTCVIYGTSVAAVIHSQSARGVDPPSSVVKTGKVDGGSGTERHLDPPRLMVAAALGVHNALKSIDHLRVGA